MCSGYGGLELAATAALGDTSTAWHAEVDPAAVATLAKHFPGTPNLGDLRAAHWPHVEPVDLLAMGVPCQAVSAAGRQQVELDPRWLWPAALTGLTALRPRAFVFENVRNLISIRKGEVWTGILADVRVAVDECGARRGGAALLASPRATDAERGPSSGKGLDGARRSMASAPLVAQIGLLPTPQARDGDGRPVPSRVVAQARVDRGDRSMDLENALALLPTPRAGDERNGHSYRNSRGEPGGLASTTLLDIAERWGKYATAVARWGALRGVAAPEPTEIGPRGGRRLAAALPEWMMGLEPGWLTGHLERGDALRLAGNGVCPQQGARAIEVLLTP